MAKRVFAIVAHPDDIEFQMAGTLLLLKEAGYEIHYMNIANGSCGTAKLSKEEIIRIRRNEGIEAANYLGAVYHESLTDDFAIYYEPKLLARIAAILRQVSPEIILLQSPQDYMEDHQNAARLAASAAFTMGMRNFETYPLQAPVCQELAIYHAQPHGNCDVLRQLVHPDIFVDISSVLERKTQMLACHKSQKSWLDQSQGMGAYLNTMQNFAKDLGKLSTKFEFAEGWRKRLHYGYGDQSFEPLEKALRQFILKASGPR